MFKCGDIVSRKKYGNDILFKIDKIVGNKVYLIGVDVRLWADATKDDLILTAIPKKKEKMRILKDLRTDLFFYLPSIILHLDSDENYMEKCIEFYKEQKVKAHCFCYSESDMPNHVMRLINEYEPGVIVITGHDAYFKNKKNGQEYKNSKYYVECVKKVRGIEKNHNNLIVIAGACQSDYESLIKAGATYASSPKKSNIHALDPAIIASFLVLSDSNKEIDIKKILSETHSKEDGIGGIITNGKMLIGYPRKGE